MAVVAGLFSASLVACDAPTVPAESPAFEPRVYNSAVDEMQLYHWPLGRTVRIYVDPTAGGSDLVQHVSAGIKAWKDVVYYREIDMAVVAQPVNADVVIHTQSAPFIVDFPTDCGTPSTLGGGVTFFCSDLGGTRLTVFPLKAGGGGQVKMDMTIDPADAPTSDGMRSLITHELGHVLGIGAHSNLDSDLMFGAPTVLRPSARDASTLRYVLHQPADLQP